MTTHHARDDWETTPDDGEALAHALRTMADDAPAPSADVPSRLRAVRSQVRRRRAAKKTALGAATLGVVAVLAVGATQLPAWDSSEPLPAEPPRPVSVACGTTVDLDPLPDDGPLILPAFAVVLEGDGEVAAGDRWNGMLRVTGGTVGPGHTVRLVDVDLVATRGLEVVGVPAEPVVPSQESAVENDTTGPRIGAHFVSCESGAPLAPGTYDVYAGATLLPGTGELPLVAGPVSIDVGDRPTTPSPVVGYQPPWLEGTPVSCGMSADDLAPLAGPGLTLETRGLATEEPGVVDTSLTNAGSERFSGVVASVGPVAWVRDGIVVAVGPNALESPLEVELAPDQLLDLGAQAIATDYCSPGTDGLFTTPVTPGDYDLVPYQGVLTSSGADYAAWAVGDPVAVTLGTDGTIVPRG
ncbi:hypothetical protein [Cellulosimicrobium protaetiae]|uniref:Uncharacterized protein n=1 Tax=Cellulosimicrobium protaetiae TaxID=2587808 RepID=A0A6M5UL09_9MICO|nr:hypothetical protein [Cellulosimicrobium protaetiae]QJW37818.1 hypothetical protein FIC82_018220 [Cellulosimicrobium protaetiae]